MPSSGGKKCALPDRKSTRLNSSHTIISYAVFCLKQKTVELLAHRAAAQPAGIAGMAGVTLRVELVPRDLDLLRVDDDFFFKGGDARRLRTLPLAAERVG